MTDKPRMLASAVVIPDDPPKPVSPNLQERPSATKRKQSFESSTDSKKPRIATENVQQETGELSNESPWSQHPNGSNPLNSPRPEPQKNFNAQESTADDTSIRRKSSHLDHSEKERGRNKRLFGGLLSTLNQSGQQPKARTRHSSSTTNNMEATTQQRRADIEAKQAAKLAAQSNAFEEEARKRDEKLGKQRELEGEIWEERAMLVRHQNERNMAGFFKTKAEPPIYWKPKRWSPAQVDIIRKQVEDAEERMKTEREQFAERKRCSKEKRETEKLEKGQAQAGVKKAEADETTTCQEKKEPQEKFAQDENNVQISEASTLTFAKPSEIASPDAKPADTTVLSEVDPLAHPSTNSASDSPKEAEHQRKAGYDATDQPHSNPGKRSEDIKNDSKTEKDASPADDDTTAGAHEDVSHNVQDHEDLHDNDDEQMHGGEGGEDAVIY
ncbi:MAG: hypothetical protein M1831_002133 [Alyxoria varia]|nr:MAG: hypothetical protein M1831_002133 [Alyxoria varia]